MSGAESADEAAMLPRMVHMEPTIIAALVVSYPAAVSMHVGRIWMSFAIVKMAVIHVMPVPVVVMTPVPVWSMFRNVFVMIAVATVIMVTAVPVSVLSQAIDGH